MKNVKTIKKSVLISVILLITLSFRSKGQIVNIPDANFKTYLLGNPAINTNGDTEIQVSEATAFTGTIDCSGLNIYDLTGIEAFVNITHLKCLNNYLNSLDISQNASLIELNCSANLLSNLDVSQNTNLKYLYCTSNILSSLNVSQNTVLIELNCSNNLLTALDVTQNTALTYLQCSVNLLSSLDVSQNTALRALFCQNNAIKNINVSQDTALIRLNCSNNSLLSLNVANGNNTNFVIFRASDNPNLPCIQVDDTAYSNANWSNYIDSTANFSLNCGIPPCIVTIPDTNFKSYLVGNPAINTNGNAEIECSEAIAFTGTIDCSGLNITNLTGIEMFVNITELNCSNNYPLGSINVTQNTSLTSLNCSTNHLNGLDVSQNTALTDLNCSANHLNGLDVSQNTALTYLDCSANPLSNIDLTQNLALTNLFCIGNSLDSLDVTQNTALTYLNCSFNSLSSLDVSQNTILTQLYCTDNSLVSLDLSQNTALTQLHCSNNSLVSLDLTQNTALTNLGCSHNLLNSLYGLQNTALMQLYCSFNSLTDLDVSQNTALIELYCSFNSLSSLNVANGNNTNFTSFIATHNPNLTCIQVDDTAYSNANWSNNIDSTASFSTSCNTGIGIDEANKLESLFIYPNPATTILTIDTDKRVKTVSITDVMGRKVKILTLCSKTIDVSDLTEGVYFLQIQTNKGLVNKKFIKE